MNGIHPKLNGAAVALAIVVLLGIIGCRTPSGSLASNPLMGPDRVPPPATRAIQPGEAKPYYPGDPVPPMQSENVVPEVAAPTNGLAWTAPNTTNGATPAVAVVNAPAPPSVSSFARTTPAMNERAVTIPTDEAELRFQAATPVAPEPVVPVANQVAVTVQESVAPAAYYEPVASVPSAAPAWQKPAVPLSQTQSVTMAPAVPPSAVMSAPPQPSYLLGPPPSYVTQNAVPQASMDVSMQAVTSPAPEPGDYGSPRIRLPGYQPAVPQVSANDGFRPRGSMR